MTSPPATSRQMVEVLLKKTESYWNLEVSNRKLEKLQEEYFDAVAEEAQKGSPLAMYLLGRIYHTSKPHPEQAKEWLTKAAEAGEIRAYANLYILSK